MGSLPFVAFLAVFFGASLLAIIFNERPQVRSAWIVSVLVLFSAAGLTGQIVYPFHNWRHYHYPASTNVDYTMIRFVGDDGQELPLDSRGFPDDVASVGLNPAIADELVEEGKDARTYAEYLVGSADDLATQVRDGTLGRPTRLRHALRRHRTAYWSPEELAGTTEIVGVRIYKLSVQLSEDGRDAEEKWILLAEHIVR